MKTRMIRSVLICLSILFTSMWIGCEDTEKKGEQELRDQVMHIHDEVMPQWNSINGLKEELNILISQLSENVTDTLGGQLSEIDGTIKQLDDSYQAMRLWMNEYNVELPVEMTHEEVMSYLGTEKEKIIAVKDELLESTANAKQLIEKYSSAQE